MSEGERNPVVRFFGWLLMGIGGLIAVTAGACSLYFLVSMVASTGSGGFGGVLGSLGLVAAFGGVPIAVGVGLFVAGRAISRPSRPTSRN